MTQKKLSLQEQLLKAGLASTAKAKQIKSEKHKESKLQKHNNVQVVDEVALNLQKLKTEQLAKDRELNAAQKQQTEKKAALAQMRQLVEQHIKPQDPDGIAYRFNDNGKIKTVYVAEATRNQLSKGLLAIVKLDKQYALVPTDIAEKVRLRDAACLVMLNKPVEEQASDPYAAFQVPDDLIW